MMKFILLNLALFTSAFLFPKSIETSSSNVSNKGSCAFAHKTKTTNSLNTKDLISVNRSSLKNPCSAEMTSFLIHSNYPYKKDVLDEVSNIIQEIKEELKKTPSTEEEIEYENDRKIALDKNIDFFKSFYPRFSLKSALPDDYLYYGIHTGDYTDASRFLGERVCNPSLSIANSEVSYLNLFFSINNGRKYGGIIRIINERITTLIEGQLGFEEIDKYFEKKYSPRANFRSWVHEDIEREYKGYIYQDQDIDQTRQSWRTEYFLSPWLYDSCNKSVAVVHNNCSLDPSYDMELKEFFYMTSFDLMLGNIFCKKSNDSGWTRIATLEFIRI